VEQDVLQHPIADIHPSPRLSLNRLLPLTLLVLLPLACAPHPTKETAIEDTETVRAPLPPVTEVQRLSTVVPWPRGAVWKDGKLLVLARGVHRSAGGPNAEIEDLAGSIFELDPNIYEPVVKGQLPGEAVQRNGRILAEATSPPFRFWDRKYPPTSDTLTDRPYAGLLYDRESENLFVICFSGIDLEHNPRFRKNATDAIHRYNLKTGKWYPFEVHDHTKVPVSELGKTVANDTYPHHDPKTNKPPHGLANGPCGGWIVGKYLYITAKENSALIQYDLEEIRRNPEAGPPNGRYIFHRSSPKDDVFIQTKTHGNMYVEGPGAVTTYGDYMYVAFRTTCQVMRFPITKDGDVVRPIVADYLAQFDPYELQGETYTTTPDFFDLRADSTGRIFISCNQYGALWEIPTNSAQFLDARKGTTAKPYVNLREITGHARSTCGNFTFDPDDNLYICAGNKELPDSLIRGVVYRVPRR
jgi:hypothetical protein